MSIPIKFRRGAPIDRVAPCAAWLGRARSRVVVSIPPTGEQMSRDSLHSDPMANFGMITQTAAKPGGQKGNAPSPIVPGEAAPCVRRWAATGSIMLGGLKKGYWGNIWDTLVAKWCS